MSRGEGQIGVGTRASGVPGPVRKEHFSLKVMNSRKLRFKRESKIVGNLWMNDVEHKFEETTNLEKMTGRQGWRKVEAQRPVPRAG